MTFSEVAERYLSQRIVSDNYAKNLRSIASRAGELGGDSLNNYLRARSATLQSTTVRSERTILMTLWRYAYEEGIAETGPRGVMRIKVRRAPTKAWTVEQLKELVDGTKLLESRRLRSGAPLGTFLRAWLLLGYECGGRFGDLWRFTGDQIDRDAIAWTQSKTGDPIIRTLSAPCLQACRSMLKLSPDGTVLGWSCGKRMAMRHMRAYLDSHCIKGTSKFLRRSGATHIEIEQPGKAKLHLGHRTPGLAESNYIDWAQVRKNAPKTPLIG